MPQNMVTASRPIAASVVAAFLRLGLAEGRDAVADRLDAGERGTAGGEGAQQQEDEREAGQALMLGLDRRGRRSAPAWSSPRTSPRKAPQRDHDEDADDEDVGRDREELAGLLHAAQVHQREQHDHADRAEHLVLDDEGHGRAEVLDAGGDRHGDGEDVVDEQRAGDGEAGPGAEVGVGHLVVAAAARVGVHVLPVGGHDGEHQHDDRDARSRG